MQSINRRAFLGHAGAILLAPVVRARTQSLRIVVVGAGMAGLSAAFDLTALGHDVTVLEARTRPGGRVFTMRDAFADGLYADAGAMQVYDSHARVQRYIKQLGLDVDPIRPAAAGSLLQVMGHRVELRPGEPAAWPFRLNADEQALSSGALYQKYVTPHLKDIYDADLKGELLSRFGKYDAMTFSDFLRSQGASANAVRVLNIGLPVGLGDGGDHHSALNLLREAAYRSLRTQSFTIRGGTDRLPKALAAQLGDRIRYGTPATSVEQNANGVRVTSARPGATRFFNADRVVIAVPFAVMSRIAFDPLLSRETRDAIAEIPNTSVVKVFLQMRSRFWLSAGQSGGASTDLPMGLLSERTINQPGTRGILESYVVGEHARRLCPLPEGDRLRAVMANLATLFPAVSEQYEGGTSKCWDEDEWARGAYAWFRPGQMSKFLPALGKAEGRIHFAGDHTSPTPGWMEGALHSAERVVSEISAS